MEILLNLEFSMCGGCVYYKKVQRVARPVLVKGHSKRGSGVQRLLSVLPSQDEGFINMLITLSAMSRLCTNCILKMLYNRLSKMVHYCGKNTQVLVRQQQWGELLQSGEDAQIHDVEWKTHKVCMLFNLQWISAFYYLILEKEKRYFVTKQQNIVFVWGIQSITELRRKCICILNTTSVKPSW